MGEAPRQRGGEDDVPAATGAPQGIRPPAVGSVAVGTVAFGTDEATWVTDSWVDHLARRGHQVLIVAPGEEWPEVGRGVGAAVAQGRAARGVVCCTTGTGVSIAANKVPGIRAALCTDATTAEGARRWNDANVLAMGLRLTTLAVGCEMLDAFMETPAEEEEEPAVGRVEPARERSAGTAGALSGQP